MVRVFFCQLVKQQVNGVLEILVIFPCLTCVNQVNQHCKVLFIFRRLIPYVGNQRRIIQFLCLYPKVLTGLLSLSFGVDNNRVYEFQNILFTPNIGKRIVVHGFRKVYGIEDFYLIPALFQHFSAFDKDCAFWISDTIRTIHLHELRFYIETCLAAPASPDDDYVLIPCILWLFRSARHHQPFRLCQQDIVLKYRIHVWLDILGSPPPCRTVFHAMPELLGIFGFEIHRQPQRNTAPCTYQ